MTPLILEAQLPADLTLRPARAPMGRTPKVTRWLALALKLEAELAAGLHPDAACLAREARITRARMSQILNLAFLAPDIQEAILNLPPIQSGHQPVTLGDLQSIALTLDWQLQRQLWQELRAK
jgi:hypothetical protein